MDTRTVQSGQELATSARCWMGGDGQSWCRFLELESSFSWPLKLVHHQLFMIEPLEKAESIPLEGSSLPED